jgi:hypothetical protein
VLGNKAMGRLSRRGLAAGARPQTPEAEITVGNRAGRTRERRVDPRESRLPTVDDLRPAEREDEIPMPSMVEFMVDDVLHAARGRPIKRLTIDIDEGGDVWFGNDLITPDTARHHRPELKRLEFASKGFVLLRGCDVARIAGVLIELARAFGVPVYASTAKYDAAYRMRFGEYVAADTQGNFLTHTVIP